MKQGKDTIEYWCKEKILDTVKAFLYDSKGDKNG